MVELSRNVHRWDFPMGKHKFLLLSDLHWDNPHCNRELLREHLDLARDNDIPVFLNGDTFCLMQGKHDPRRAKKNIRPEHNVNDYIDAVIRDAVDWFEPYKDVIKLIGYGNHETSIIRNLETDPLRRFVDLFNATHGTSVYAGGYGGWIILRVGDFSYKIKYFHGSGGGGAVTKGVIQNQRQMAMVQGMDCVWMGHVHESYAMYHTIECLDRLYNVKLKNVLHVRTPSYKEEYDGGYMDFHVERGRPPKPLGGYCLTLEGNKVEITATAEAWL